MESTKYLLCSGPCYSCPLSLLVCVQQAGWEGSEICCWLTLGRKAVKPAGFWNVWDLSIETNVKAVSVEK